MKQATTLNNFDKSSTGTDIEFTGYYDTYMSQRRFDESITMLQHSGYSTISIGYYMDNGNVEGPDAITFKVKGERTAKEKHFIENGRYYDAAEVKAWDDETLDAEILALEEDVNLINYALDEGYSHRKNYRMPNIEGLEFVPSKNLIVFSVRGYSQGDYALVLYCPEDLESVWGKEPKQEDVAAECHHLFYDAPVFAVVTVNDKEYNIADMPEFREYEWQRDEFIQYVSKESAVPADLIGAVIPRELTYS